MGSVSATGPSADCSENCCRMPRAGTCERSQPRGMSGARYWIVLPRAISLSLRHAAPHQSLRWPIAGSKSARHALAWPSAPSGCVARAPAFPRPKQCAASSGWCKGLASFVRPLGAPITRCRCTASPAGQTRHAPAACRAEGSRCRLALRALGARRHSRGRHQAWRFQLWELQGAVRASLSGRTIVWSPRKCTAHAHPPWVPIRSEGSSVRRCSRRLRDNRDASNRASSFPKC